MKSRGGHHEFQSNGHAGANGASDRSFGFVMAGAFALIAIVNAWHSGRAWPWLAGLAAAFLLLALVRPDALTLLNKYWIRLGIILASVVSPVVLGLLFLIGFTPIAIVARLVGKDFLRLRSQPEATSYWIIREPPGPEPGSMKDQF